MEKIFTDPNSLFYTDLTMMVWTWVILGLLLFITWWKIWPAIARGMDQRAAKVQADLQRAREAAQGAASAEEEMRRILNQAKAEAHEWVNQAKEDAVKIREAELAKVRAATQQQVDAALADLSKAQTQALTDLRQTVIGLTTDITGKLTERAVDPNQQKGLIEEYFHVHLNMDHVFGRGSHSHMER